MKPNIFLRQAYCELVMVIKRTISIIHNNEHELHLFDDVTVIVCINLLSNTCQTASLSESLAAVRPFGHPQHVLAGLKGGAVAPAPGVAVLGRLAARREPPAEAVGAGHAARAHPPGQKQARVAGVSAAVRQTSRHVDEIGLGAGG